MENNLYKQVYYHAVRRAMLENETILKIFMDTVAVNYDDAKLIKLDELLVKIFDNDLFDVVMGNKSADFFEGVYDTELLKEIAAASKNMIKK